MKFTAAFITGAGGGLGRAFALDLARRGANVFVTDVKLEGAEETARLARELGVRASAAGCDVRDAKSVEAAAAKAEAELGPIDLCVNNAGVMVGGDIGGLSLDDWRFAVDVNLWGTIHGFHAFTPRFKERRRGHFLSVASIAGIISTPETAPYNVTKAAIISLSETAYGELGKWDVGTTVLCPTAVKTGIFDAMRSDNPMHKKLALKNAASPGPREPSDVARIAVDAAERGRLYVFPQPDAMAAWYAKRWFAGLFARFSRYARTSELLERSVRTKR